MIVLQGLGHANLAGSIDGSGDAIWTILLQSDLKEGSSRYFRRFCYNLLGYVTLLDNYVTANKRPKSRYSRRFCYNLRVLGPSHANLGGSVTRRS